jgi:hypothetical protein
MLEDENTQLKESLRKGEGKGDAPRLDAVIAMERASTEEKKVLQVEVNRLKEQLKVMEGQTSRDATVIATLEERLKESGNTGPADLDGLEGEDWNDEINTSRKDLYVSYRVQLTADVFRLFGWRGNLLLQKQKFNTTQWLERMGTTSSFYAYFSDGQGTELRERFVKYETELSAANRKIADRAFPP